MGYASGGHTNNFIEYTRGMEILPNGNFNMHLYLNAIIFAAYNNQRDFISKILGFKGGEWTRINTAFYVRNALGLMTDYALYGAAWVNNRELIEDLRRNNPTSYNLALTGAALNGSVDLIKYFISLGADNFTEAYAVSISKSNTEAGEYLLSQYDIDINDPAVIEKIISENNIPMVKYLISNGFNNWVDGIQIARNNLGREKIEDILSDYMNRN